MAQAYEYKVVAHTNSETFAELLATEDADGWDVVNYSSGWGGGSTFTWSALLRRRV